MEIVTAFVKRCICLAVIISSFNTLSAASFDDLSKSFVVLSGGGKQYLCVAVKMDDATYALTSQSLFMNPIPKFRLKAFSSGKSIKPTGFDISKLGDFARIKLGVAADSGLVPLEKGGGGGNKVYAMNPDTGIIFNSNAGGGNLSGKDFKCVAGAPVISKDGKFVGVASRTDDGFGKKNEEYKVATLADEKWQEEKPGLLAKQVYSISKWGNFTNALEKTRDNFSKNTLIEINENTHPKLIGWYKDQNKFSFARMLAKKIKGKGSMGKAMREHEDRCFQYTNLKRLASFYSSNAQMAKKAKWKSTYLRNKGKKLYEENIAHYKDLRKRMKSMVDMYPSIKAKY